MTDVSQQSTFGARFAIGPPVRAERDRRSPLAAEEIEYMVWRRWRGDGHARVARAIGVSRSSVSAFWGYVRDCPAMLSELHLSVSTRVPSDAANKTVRGFVCFVCGVTRKGTGNTALQHVIDHFFSGSVDAKSLSEEQVVAFRAERSEERRRRQQQLGGRRHRKGLGRLLRR